MTRGNFSRMTQFSALKTAIAPGWWVAISFGLGLLLVAPSAIAQQPEGEGSSTPEVQLQRESVKVEPYTGPPIFLPKVGDPIPPKAIESRVVVDFHPKEDGTRPETLSLTLAEARSLETTGAEGRQVHVLRTVTRFSDDSFKNEGPFKEFYPNGQIFVEGTYRDGVKSGDWKFFHANGNEAKIVTYENGLPHGSIELRRADGTLQAKREFAEGKRTGTWTTYDETGEKVLIEAHYKDGLPDGLWQTWHPNGQLSMQQPFVDGKRHGTVKTWDDTGKQVAEVNFAEGERHGVGRQWLADGRVVEQTFEKGKTVSTKILEN